MNTPALFRLFATGIAALVLSACATRPIAEWQDESFSGPIDNILIIGASDPQTKSSIVRGYVCQGTRGP